MVSNDYTGIILSKVRVPTPQGYQGHRGHLDYKVISILTHQGHISKVGCDPSVSQSQTSLVERLVTLINTSLLMMREWRVGMHYQMQP